MPFQSVERQKRACNYPFQKAYFAAKNRVEINEENQAIFDAILRYLSLFWVKMITSSRLITGTYSVIL